MIDDEVDDDDDDDDDEKHIISNYVVTVVIESSIKFDVLLQVTEYMLQCSTLRFLLISGTCFLTFPHFSLMYSQLLSL
jgi:hypothetical protein